MSRRPPEVCPFHLVVLSPSFVFEYEWLDPPRQGLTWLSTRLKIRPPPSIRCFTSLCFLPPFDSMFGATHLVMMSFSVPPGPALGRTRHSSALIIPCHLLFLYPSATTTLIRLRTYPYDPSRPYIPHVILAYLSFSWPALFIFFLLSLYSRLFLVSSSHVSHFEPGHIDHRLLSFFVFQCIAFPVV
jgi:hypothetical protein